MWCVRERLGKPNVLPPFNEMEKQILFFALFWSVRGEMRRHIGEIV